MDVSRASSELTSALRTLEEYIRSENGRINIKVLVDRSIPSDFYSRLTFACKKSFEMARNIEKTVKFLKSGKKTSPKMDPPEKAPESSQLELESASPSQTQTQPDFDPTSVDLLGF